MRPHVSVLMPVLRPEPAFLLRAVESVLAQRLGDLELVIVEDKGGIPVADILGHRLDARVRLLTNDARTGLVAQRNRALHEARAELVAMLDADDVAEPDRLAVQVRRLAAEPGLAVLGSAIQLVDADERPIAVRRYPLAHGEIVATMPRENPLAQSAVLARRGALLASGGYRFAIDHTGEDYELWSRLARAGARFANLATPLVRHRIHAGASKAQRVRALLRSTIAVKQRHWAARMGLVDRLRMGAEAALLFAPPGFVMRMFLTRQRLRG